MLQHPPPFSATCSMKLMNMIEIPLMDDTFTTVPDWFVKYYESGFIWVGFAVMGVAVIVLTVMACKLYYEFKEIQDFLERREEENRINNISNNNKLK